VAASLEFKKKIKMKRKLVVMLQHQ